MEEQAEFLVGGEQRINCAGCEQRIGNALQRLAGVKQARASAQTQRISVHFDPLQVSPVHIQSRLEQLGYQVSLQRSPS